MSDSERADGPAATPLNAPDDMRPERVGDEPGHHIPISNDSLVWTNVSGLSLAIVGVPIDTVVMLKKELDTLRAEREIFCSRIDHLNTCYENMTKRAEQAERERDEFHDAMLRQGRELDRLREPPAAPADESPICQRCKGSGEIPVYVKESFEQDGHYETGECYECSGTGSEQPADDLIERLRSLSTMLYRDGDTYTKNRVDEAMDALAALRADVNNAVRAHQAALVQAHVWQRELIVLRNAIREALDIDYDDTQTIVAEINAIHSSLERAERELDVARNVLAVLGKHE